MVQSKKVIAQIRGLCAFIKTVTISPFISADLPCLPRPNASLLCVPFVWAYVCGDCHRHGHQRLITIDATDDSPRDLEQEND